MSQIIKESKISKGHLELDNIPFEDDTEMKVILIPKVKTDKMSFKEIRKLMKGVKGNLSDDIIHERNNEWIFLLIPVL